MEAESESSNLKPFSKMLLWRVSNAIVSGFFFLAGFVQMNDPDSVFWVTLYIIPAIICLLYSLNYPRIFLLKELVGVHIVFTLAVSVYTSIQLTRALSDENGLLLHELEETRELGGSCFVVCWLLLNVKYLYSEPSNQRKLSRVLAVIAILPILLWSSAHLSTSYQAKLPQHCKTAFSEQTPQTIVTMSE